MWLHHMLYIPEQYPFIASPLPLALLLHCLLPTPTQYPHTMQDADGKLTWQVTLQWPVKILERVYLTLEKEVVWGLRADSQAQVPKVI